MCRLISSPRLKPGDLKVWRLQEQTDLFYLQRYRKKLEEMEQRSLECIKEFFYQGNAYCSVSWGKDSVVVASMCRKLDLPMGYIRIEPYNNPECDLVRDAFAPNNYYEAVVKRDGAICSHASGVFQEGVKLLETYFGTDRRITGIRKDESQARRLRGFKSTERSCVPIANWTAQDVFAYLQWQELPIHPAYAMSNEGQFDRKHLRVASIGGDRGKQFNRRAWEEIYYPDILWQSEISPN